MTTMHSDVTGKCKWAGEREREKERMRSSCVGLTAAAAVAVINENIFVAFF